MSGACVPERVVKITSRQSAAQPTGWLQKWAASGVCWGWLCRSSLGSTRTRSFRAEIITVTPVPSFVVSGHQRVCVHLLMQWKLTIMKCNLQPLLYSDELCLTLQLQNEVSEWKYVDRLFVQAGVGERSTQPPRFSSVLCLGSSCANVGTYFVNKMNNKYQQMHWYQSRELM